MDDLKIQLDHQGIHKLNSLYYFICPIYLQVVNLSKTASQPTSIFFISMNNSNEILFI